MMLVSLVSRAISRVPSALPVVVKLCDPVTAIS